jgi:hypothetical protein
MELISALSKLDLYTQPPACPVPTSAGSAALPATPSPHAAPPPRPPPLPGGTGGCSTGSLTSSGC